MFSSFIPHNLAAAKAIEIFFKLKLLKDEINFSSSLLNKELISNKPNFLFLEIFLIIEYSLIVLSEIIVFPFEIIFLEVLI